LIKQSKIIIDQPIYNAHDQAIYNTKTEISTFS